MEKILLEVQVRDLKLSPSYLRSQRRIPAICYGHKEKSMALEVDYQSFRKAFDRAGGNQVIELSVDGKKKPVLVHDVQYDPLTDKVAHIDFINISMDEEVKANIPVVVTGLAPAVKNLGGILTTLKHEIEVRCLPGDLPQNITVDVSALENLHSSIHIRDIDLPKGVKVTAGPDEVIVTVAPPKAEEEVATPAATEAAPVAGAEGAAPAEGAAAEAAPEKGKKE